MFGSSIVLACQSHHPVASLLPTQTAKQGALSWFQTPFYTLKCPNVRISDILNFVDAKIRYFAVHSSCISCCCSDAEGSQAAGMLNHLRPIYQKLQNELP